MKRYQPTTIANPEGPLAKDLQAWRKAIANAKIQIEYNSNHLMNLEIQQELLAKELNNNKNNNQVAAGGATNALSNIWLQYNETIETLLDKHVMSTISSKKRMVDEINRSRYQDQCAVDTELQRMNKRRLIAIDKSLLIRDAMTQGSNIS